MKLITITIAVDDEAVVRSVTSRANGARRAPKKSKYKYPSASPEAISATANAQMILAYVTKHKRPVKTGPVARILKKKGLSPNTATPLLSALVRAGHITRVRPGVFARAA